MFRVVVGALIALDGMAMIDAAWLDVPDFDFRLVFDDSLPEVPVFFDSPEW